MIALVAAMDEARLIGVGGRLPWHAPADLAHFRALTMGGVVVMGRRTWESLPGPLAERTNVVLSRRGDSLPCAAVTAVSIDRVLRYFAGRNIYVIGGARVFAQALPLADVLHLTRIRHTFPVGDGAVYFPAWEGFRLVASEERAADAANPWPMVFERWERG